MLKPFYDPEKTYDENYNKGPFGVFAESAERTNHHAQRGDGKVLKQDGEPQHEYMGEKVYLPFGIPAGPILNSNFARAAFEKGFDLVVYKTVRSDFFPCHPFPNVLSVDVQGDLTVEKLQQPLIASTHYGQPLSITNSFGVPSKKADVWQEDVKRAIDAAGKGQVLILSFMGTVKPNQTQQEFIDDYILAAKLAHETGAKILETNLSCPNIGNEGLVCYNLEVTEAICKGIRKVIGKVPFIIKVGYYTDEKQLEQLAAVANEYADTIAAINTLQAEVRDEKGEQALPGPNRLKSGICGSAIKWAGIDMVKRLKNIRDKNGYKFAIEGVGGVTTVQDYFDYKRAGADSVMSATGAMWNPLLAQEIKAKI